MVPTCMCSRKGVILKRLILRERESYYMDFVTPSSILVNSYWWFLLPQTTSNFFFLLHTCFRTKIDMCFRRCSVALSSPKFQHQKFSSPTATEKRKNHTQKMRRNHLSRTKSHLFILRKFFLGSAYDLHISKA